VKMRKRKLKKKKKKEKKSAKQKAQQKVTATVSKVARKKPEKAALSRSAKKAHKAEKKPKDAAAKAKKLEEQKAAKYIRSHVSFGDKSAHTFDHIKEKPNIVKIKKFIIRCKEKLESFQVVYELSDKTEWETPVYGQKLKIPNPDDEEDEEWEYYVEKELSSSEYITNIEGRASKEINGLLLDVTKKYPNGITRKDVQGKKGDGSGQRFSMHGNLKLVGFYGNYNEHGVTRLGFYFRKDVIVNGQTKTYATWADAVSGRQLSFYYLPLWGKPGFSPPKLADAGDEAAEENVNFVIEGFQEFLDEEEKKDEKAQWILSDEFRLHTTEEVPSLLLSYNLSQKLLMFQTSFVSPYRPVGIDSLKECEPGEEYTLFEKGTDLANNFAECMDYIMELVNQKIGWTVRALMIVYADEEKHRAYYKKIEKKRITVVECDRSPEEYIILSDVDDAQQLKSKFESKYNEVMRKN